MKKVHKGNSGWKNRMDTNPGYIGSTLSQNPVHLWFFVVPRGYGVIHPPDHVYATCTDYKIYNSKKTYSPLFFREKSFLLFWAKDSRLNLRATLMSVSQKRRRSTLDVYGAAISFIWKKIGIILSLNHFGSSVKAI